MEGPRSDKGPSRQPQGGIGAQGVAGPGLHPGAALSPTLGFSATYLDRTHVKGVKNNPSLLLL